MEITNHNLAQRIAGLATILNATRTETYIEKTEYGCGSGDGHSFDDRPDILEREMTAQVLVYSEKERKEALRELKRIRKMDLDETERGLVSRIFNERKAKRRAKMRAAVPNILKAGTFLAVLAGCSVYGIRDCIYDSKVEEGKSSIRAIERMEEEVRYFESKGYYRSAEHYRKELELYRENKREDIEKGEIIVNQGDYEKYLGAKSQDADAKKK